MLEALRYVRVSFEPPASKVHRSFLTPEFATMPTTLFASLGRYMTLLRRESLKERPIWSLQAHDSGHASPHAVNRRRSLVNRYLPRVRGSLPTGRSSRHLELLGC